MNLFNFSDLSFFNIWKLHSFFLKSYFAPSFYRSVQKEAWHGMRTNVCHVTIQCQSGSKNNVFGISCHVGSMKSSLAGLTRFDTEC